MIANAEGKPDEAKEVYTNILKTDPKNVEAMVALSEQARLAGDIDGALSWVDKAIQTSPQALEPRLRQVELLLVQGKPQKALAAASVMTNTFPDKPEALKELARAQHSNGRDDDAAATVRQVYALQPISADQQLDLAHSLLSLNFVEEARKAYMQAIKINPGYFPAWRDLVLIDVRAGHMDKALETAKKASDVDKFLGNLVTAEAYANAKLYDQADASLVAAQAQHPNPLTVLRRAELRDAAGDAKGGRKIMADWLATNPDDNSVRRSYAESLLAARILPEATKEHEILLQHSPLNVVLLNNLAWLYQQQKNPKALDVARKANGLAPGSPEVKDTLGWILADKGETKEALELLNLAHVRRPNNNDIAYHLGAVLAKTGDKTGAVTVLKPAVESDKPFEQKAAAAALLKTLQ